MSGDINNGGPAFPFEEKHTDGTHYHAHAGMSLRDYFAAKAMQGLCASFNAEYNIGALPELCYALADAMLKAREVQR